MTKKEVKAAIKAAGATAKWDAELGEWRVNVPGGSERTAYYTPDDDDAIGTAKLMMKK